MPTGPVYRFGPFEYDAGQRTLSRQGEVLALAPKSLETLHILLERRGQIVEKSELMARLWPDTNVEETGLARNISLLRKALGDEAEAGAYIETIPKRGYRFKAETAPQVRRWWLAGLPLAAALAGLLYWQFYLPSRYLPPGNATLAVIPFECLTPELERGSFSRTLNEALVAELSRLPGVRVLSPSTVRRYRCLMISPAVMARVAGLPLILEGTARNAGGRLYITARLADVHTGLLVWAGQYEFPAGAELQAAQTITAALRGPLQAAK